MCPKGNQSVNAEWRSECPLFAQTAQLLSIIISNFSFAGTMMSVLSQKASLSQKYTNHSLRTTSEHILDATQIPTRHIMSVTGHKAETSLKTYTVHTNNKKKPMSNIITKSAGAVSDINNSSEQAESAYKDIPDFTLEPVSNSQYDDLMDDLNSA